MKALEKLGELVISVWAAVVRTVLPRYCVKSLTLKTNPSAWRYMLGAEKELKLIDKLQLSDEEIAARCWSHGTKVTLLYRECDALIAEVHTEEEIDALVSQRSMRSLIKAMKVYTPTKAKMKEICRTLAPQEVLALAKGVPSAFEGMNPADILGRQQVILPVSAEQWQVFVALAEAKPAWSIVFLKWLRNIVPSKLGEDGQKLMQAFFDIAFTAKVDLSEFMPYFCVFQPEMYAKVRASLLKVESVSSYFRMMFPQLLKYLSKSMDTYFSLIEVAGKLKDEEDIYAWLRIGFEHLNERGVYQCMLENLAHIKSHIIQSLFDRLVVKLIETAPTGADLYELHRFANEEQKELIFEALVLRAEKNEAGVSLRGVFPFEGMPEALVLRAVKTMVRRKQFPVERVSELSEAMQAVAFEEMETQSQIETINIGDVNVLVEMMKLYPRAERHLLRNGFEKPAYEYFQRVQIDPTTFSWILQTSDLSRKFKEALVFRYAEKWGLNQSEYMQIMQSRLTSQASFLKKHLREA